MACGIKDYIQLETTPIVTLRGQVGSWLGARQLEVDENIYGPRLVVV